MWFQKDKAPRALRDPRTPSPIVEGLFLKCEGCRETLYAKEVERSLRICPKCGFNFRFNFRLPADERLRLLLDEGSVRLVFGDVCPADPLRFKDTRTASSTSPCHGTR